MEHTGNKIRLRGDRVSVADLDQLGYLDWPLYRKHAPTHAMRVEGPFTVDTSEGPLTCLDGYLAVDARGYPYPIAAEEFERIYEPLPADAPPTADDPVTCQVCTPPSKQTLGTIVNHLVNVHGMDAEDILTAPIVVGEKEE